ncbi:MAG TPA: ABC transporter permease [Acidimicrobiales bacterium]|nr:ABC transporter permease [Acidimicrobiales bacterium]
MFSYVVIGLFTGAVYALAAMGLVLNYKIAGIFNFAYGAIAMFCAFTFSQFRDVLGLSQWFSVPLVLFGLAPLIGVLMERLFRPLTAAPAEIQIVVSLGVLAFFQALVPIVYGGQARGLHSIFPTSTFKVGSNLHVGYDQLATLLLAIGLGLALWLLLRKTKFGMATRAVVDNRDLSALAGVRAETVSRVAWVISCVFAGLVGILLSSAEGLDVFVLVLLVIYAFAPAVLGKLVSLPLAFIGAIVLGVLQSILTKYGSVGTVADIEASIPYAALFILLVAYGTRLKEVRSSSRPLRSPPPRPIGPPAVTAGAIIVGVALVLPALLRPAQVGDVTIGIIFAAIGITLVVLTGWAGQISLAQFSFVGIGAFTVGHLAGHHGGGFFPAALLGALIAIPVGLIVGLPSLRLSGLYLALATMAFALLMDNLIFNRPSISGGYTGMAINRPKLGPWSFASTTSFYYLCLAILGIYAVGAAILRRGPIGRRLQMINDSPLAASTFGVSLTLTKLMTFALCAAAAAFAGALFGAARLTVSPGDFSFNSSLELLLLVVLGGRSLVAGALMAGVVYGAQLFPIPTTVEQYIPLGVAVGVIGIANNPEGPIVLTVKIVRKFLAVFQPLPRDDVDVIEVAEPRTPAFEPSEAGMHQTPLEAHA